MKKIICSVVLAFLLFSLSACGNVDVAAVDEALQGEWTMTASGGGQSVYIFEDGKFSCEMVIDGISLMDARTGTYEVASSKIKLHYDNGVDADLDYTYENGELKLEPIYE